jgi:hypothetical protein
MKKKVAHKKKGSRKTKPKKKFVGAKAVRARGKVVVTKKTRVAEKTFFSPSPAVLYRTEDSNRLVILNLSIGEIVELNPAAAYAWQLIVMGKSSDEIEVLFSDKFKGKEQVINSLKPLLSKLIQTQLIIPSSSKIRVKTSLRLKHDFKKINAPASIDKIEVFPLNVAGSAY